jgi:hypothetical protein
MGVEPSSPRVLVRQHRPAGEAGATSATVQGNVLIVRGRYSLRGGCRTLSGVLDEKPGALKLKIIGTAPRQPCAEESG